VASFLLFLPRIIQFFGVFRGVFSMARPFIPMIFGRLFGRATA